MNKTLLLIAAALTINSAATAQQITSSTPSKYLSKVLDYSPAPGQFTNALPQYQAGDDAAKMAQKCTQAIANNNGGMITLGAYGGSVTFCFDHSIANIAGKKDFYIQANAFAGNSEPGIVMVSKDVNRNGIADDPWYELEGSAETDMPGHVTYNYELTYTAKPMQNIPWTDNQGNSGTVDRNSFHQQEYYPLWLGNTMTVKGTLLPQNATKQGSIWTLKAFTHGYVDNKPNTDSTACSFDIDNAVDNQRRKVNLDFVDFIKVYTALQQQAGWLGETSTEIVGAEDLHLQASIDAIQAQQTKPATFEDISLALNADGYYNGDTNGQKYTNAYGADTYKCTYTSGSYSFDVHFTPAWASWSGVALSNRTPTVYNTLNPDQYNSCVGHGYNNSANYAVVYVASPEKAIEVTNKPEGDQLKGFYITNTAWTLSAIKNGDSYTTGPTGRSGFETGDWLKLTITATKADNSTTNIEVYLADYRSANQADHYYIGDWQWVDLSPLGTVKYLSFSMSSSRNNQWGMTTPAYFCIDNFNDDNDGKNGKVTAIQNITNDGANKTEVARYTIDGKRIQAPIKGINIIKYSDGTVQKVIVR